MSFVDLQNFSNPPKRVCSPPFGSILEAFPPQKIEDHDRLGYAFRGEPCNTVADYDADVCQPGDIKMDPDGFGPTREAELRVVQAAFKCSAIGATDDELRFYAKNAIDRNFWRAADQALIDALTPIATPFAGPFPPALLYANAVQFLATSSFCGTGIIYGPAAFVAELFPLNYLYKEGNRIVDILGNIIIPSSDSDLTVYAFDSEIEIKASNIDVFDQFAPGLTTVNDRVVRAEMVYTVAVDPCAVASFGFIPCCDCGGSPTTGPGPIEP